MPPKSEGSEEKIICFNNCGNFKVDFKLLKPTVRGRDATNMCHVLRKLGKMHVRKVSSQISMCSRHRLIWDDTFGLNWIFTKKRHHLNEKFHKSVNCCTG